MRKKEIKEYQKQIEESLKGYDNFVFASMGHIAIKGSGKVTTANIMSLISALKEYVPVEIIKDSIEYALKDEKAQDIELKTKIKQSKKVEKLLKEKLKKKEATLSDLKEIIEELEKLENNK